MLRRFVNWLALTRSEQRVLLFLTATLMVGAGIRLYQETSPAQRTFDYRALDSSFAVFRGKLAADSIPRHQALPGAKININTAAKEQLVTLPGIGGTLAERIIAYRESGNKFRSAEDLRNVKGISGKKLDKLKPLVTVQ